jgi:hypothetical protein
MPQSTHQNKALPALAACCLLMAGAASGHTLLGVVCAAAVFAGLYIRQLPGKRLIGNALFLVGALGFSLGLFLTTGYLQAKTWR